MLNDWKSRVLINTQPTLTMLNGKHLYTLNLRLIMTFIENLLYASTWAKDFTYFCSLNPYKVLISESLLAFHFADEA